MKRSILLVDDELAVLLTLKAVLESQGFEVETARSAREAVDKLSSRSYHMVISDLRMETDSAGHDVVQAARLQPYNPAVALLTAYPSADLASKSGGAQNVLVKPMNTRVLLRQIEALLIRHEDEKQRLKQPSPAVTPRRGPARRAS